MTTISPQKEKRDRMSKALEAQRIEREKNLRIMLAKGEITRAEFDQKMSR